MQLTGLIIGAATFILIGLLHVAVIKVEYHLGAEYWPALAIAGMVLLGASVLFVSPLISGVLGAADFAVAWSAPELIKQRERVEKGWFPGKEK